MKNKNYGILNLRIIDNIIEKKRFEMLNILQTYINTSQINSFLDIGTTEDESLKSSNFFVKQFNYISTKKSISDQNITNEKFTKVLKKSIIKGGSSIRDFKNTSGDKGSFQNEFKVYNRENLKCTRISCSGKIYKISITNRSSFFCNKCQK